jgi:hypothetical protein
MRRWLTPAALIGLMLLSAVGTHKVQQSVDVLRRANAVDTKYTFLPSPEAMGVVSMGFDIMMADVMWIRTVLQFVDVSDAGGQQGLRWLHAMLDTVIHLDPRWRTTYFYGGSMLRVLGDIEGSDRIFGRGKEALPADHYFPFSLAMNAYLYHHDTDTAVAHLVHAADLPSAPRWYRTAVGAFIHKSGQRRTALRYLKEQAASASTDKERIFLQNKYRTVLHEELASQLEDRRRTWESDNGRALPGLEVLGQLPPDPYGTQWILAYDGAIRSQHMDTVVASREKLDERSMLTRRWLRAK